MEGPATMRISRAGIWNSMSRSGFTLIEVLVALSLAAIGMLGLIQLQLTSMAAADKADRTTQATLLAQSLINEAISQGINEPSQDTGTNTSSTPPMHWRVTITRERQLSRPTTQPIYRIQAQIGWDDHQQILEFSRLYCAQVAL